MLDVSIVYLLDLISCPIYIVLLIVDVVIGFCIFWFVSVVVSRVLLFVEYWGLFYLCDRSCDFKSKK
jgi:hypothetical protein